VNRAKSDAEYVRVRDHILTLVKQEKLTQGRLPTERELAERLTVGRGVTRRVHGGFEAKGLLHRHVGRGTFIGVGREDILSDNGDGAAPTNKRSPAAYIEARLRFEPELAWMIVAHATTADPDLIRDLMRRSEKANTVAALKVAAGISMRHW
jgi:GntR family transcriptional repressor for pyruvate dehydrogenase complex